MSVCILNVCHIVETLTVCMLHCYHLLYSLQYSIEGLCNAAGDGRLEDVKKHVQNGVDVNSVQVSDCINPYMSHMFIIIKHMYLMCRTAMVYVQLEGIPSLVLICDWIYENRPYRHKK